MLWSHLLVSAISIVAFAITTVVATMSLTAIVTPDECAQVKELIALSDSNVMTWQSNYVFNNTLVLQVLDAENDVLGEARIAVTEDVRSYCDANQIPTHRVDDAFDGSAQFAPSADYPDVYNANGSTLENVIDSENAKRANRCGQFCTLSFSCVTIPGCAKCQSILVPRMGWLKV